MNDIEVVMVNMKSITAVAFLLAAQFGFSEDEGNKSPDTKEYFDIQIIQDNQIIPITGNEVKINRAPFTLVLILKEKIGVLTNFSVKPLLFDGFSHGKPLSKILEEPDLFMGMAEYDLNPDKTIFIDNILPHYLYYDNEQEHRFSFVEIKDGLYYCCRDIDFYRFPGQKDKQPIKNLHYDTLYTVFLYSEYDDSWNRIEKQSAFLKINFK